ncbi:hypothetical protein P9112_009321 [Eukaryota sp. TZLM1-RC]
MVPWSLRQCNQCRTFCNRDTNSALNILMLDEDILDGRERSEVFIRQQSQTNVIEPTDASLKDVEKSSKGDGIPMSPIQQPDLNTLSRVAKAKVKIHCIVKN